MRAPQAAELGFAGAVAAAGLVGAAYMLLRGPYAQVGWVSFYYPQAYNLATWSAGYFIGIRRRFGARAPLAFVAAFTASETIYQVAYPAYSALFVGYIYASTQWPLFLGAFTVGFALSWRLSGASLGRPLRWWGWLVLATYVGGYFVGYGLLRYEPPTLAGGNLYDPSTAIQDCVGNAEFVALFCAVVRPLRARVKG